MVLLSQGEDFMIWFVLIILSGLNSHVQVLLGSNGIPSYPLEIMSGNMKGLSTIHNRFESCKPLMNFTLGMYTSSILQTEIGIAHSACTVGAI